MKATLYLIIATSLWGLNYHFARLVLSEVDFLEGGFWRYALAVLTLLLVNIKKLPSLATLKENFKGIFYIGAIGLFGFNFFFFKGMQSTTGVNGALIMGLNPAITLLLSSLILKTTIKSKHYIGLTISLLGVLYLLLKGDFGGVTELSFQGGDVLVLISVIFFALHHVWVKKYSSDKVNNQQFTLMSALFCFSCFTVIMPFIPLSDFTDHSATFWVGAIGIGCLGTGLAYLFWNRGVKLAGAHNAGIFVNLVPLSAGISASLFGETLFYYHFISGGVIIFGLIIMQTKILDLKWR